MDAKSHPEPGEPVRCPDCGAPLPEGWPKGLCSSCALREALADPPAATPQASAAQNGGPAAHPNPPASQPDGPFLRRFGDYDLLEEIARGGMGVVYRARQRSLNRLAALKMILSGPQASRQEVLRFRGEAEAAANLRHPNIVPIFETGEHEGQHYFSMEYVRGSDLGARVRADGPVAPRAAARYVQAVALAIHYAHGQGVLHRDLKPSNVLIDENDQPRVTDFGLAKRARNEFDLTVTGQVLGSPQFMPPEQAGLRSAKVGPPADVYGLGAILYFLLTGRPPFQATTLEAVLLQLREQDPVPPRLLNPSIPRDLETLCLKCLEKDPGRRPPTAQELANEIGRFLRQEPIHARPVGSLERLWRWSRRKPAVALLILLLHLIAGAGLAGILWQWQRARVSAQAEGVMRTRAEAQAYASDMNLAQQALAGNHLGRARELLQNHIPTTDAPDRRGWEWRYLWGQTRGDELLTLCQKPMAIFSLAASADGRWLAVGERNRGHLSLWNLKDRTERVRIPDGERPDVFYIRAVFSPTEPLLAYAFSSGYPPTNLATYIRFWDLDRNAQVGEIPLDFLCSGLGFSPDGRRLVTSTPNGLTIWDVQKQQPLARFSGGSHQGSGTPFALTPDFRLVAQAASGGRIRVFDLAAGRELWSRTLPGESVHAVALSDDGRWLAFDSSSGVIQLCTAQSGEPVTQLEGHRGQIVQLLFVPGGQGLASAGTDQTIRLWDLSQPTNAVSTRVWIGHELEVWRLAWLPDGHTLVSGGKDGRVCLWDTRSPQQPRGPLTLPGGPYLTFEFTPAPPRLLTCDARGRVVEWSGTDFQLRQERLDVGSAVIAARLVPDRAQVVLALTNGTLGLWSWTNLSAAQPLPSSFRNLSVPFANSDSWEWILQPHGNRLAIGRFDQQTVYDFDLDSVELKASWKAPGTLSALAFTPDDRFCVMSAYRGQLLAHDLVSGRQTEISDFVPNILGVQTAPGGRQLAVCSEHGSVHLWESPSWRSVGVLGGFLHAVTSLAFSPDGQRLAAGSDGAELLRVFDLQSRLPLITLPGDRPLVQIAFDPTGNDLAGLDVQGQLHLWRAPSPSAIDAAAPAPPH